MTALQKVTDILEIFLNHEELSVAELSKLSGLNKSTIHRIASYLVKKGYLKQAEKRGKYSLGTKFLDFSAAIKERVKIREIVTRYLIDLKQTVEESCGLVIWDGQEATLIDTIAYNSALRASPGEVSRLPLHATSAGKIFLSNMTTEQLEKYLDAKSLEQYTPKTITDKILLRKELILVKQEGLAYDTDEHIIGISSIGTGIKDIDGNINAAVVIIAPTARFTRDKMKKVTPHLKKYAIDISRDLGWKGN